MKITTNPILLALPLLVAFLTLVGCGTDTKTASVEGAQTVSTGCGSCIYSMPGVEGCQAAVKIDGKTYLVSGTEVDAHGLGLCSKEKQAQAIGKIEGDKFVATSFTLVK